MAKLTGVARYLHALTKQTPNHRPNKRLRKAAWHEARALLAAGVARDREVIAGVRRTADVQRLTFADALYGAQKFGRDVSQELIIPNYRSEPREPEHGFRLIYVNGMPMRLWFEDAWVKLGGALLRLPSSSGLRTTLAAACLFQERRRWVSASHRLNFCDQVIRP